MTPLLEVEGLKKHFAIRKGFFSRASGNVYAVDGVSFSIGRGETLGLVGGLQQPEHGASDRGFAAARFTHQT